MSAGTLIRVINVSELLAVMVPHDEAGIVIFLDSPGRREAASLRQLGDVHRDPAHLLISRMSPLIRSR